MMKSIVRTACALVVAAGIGACLSAMLSRSTSAAPAPAGGPIRYLSPISVIADKAGKTLYVAEATGHQVGVVDVASGKVTRNLPLPGEVTGVTLSPDGKQLFVTAGVPDGKVVVFDVATCKQVSIREAGHSPMAPVVAEDGTVYVCDRFRNCVLAFAGDKKPLVISKCIPLGPKQEMDSVRKGELFFNDRPVSLRRPLRHNGRGPQDVQPQGPTWRHRQAQRPADQGPGRVRAEPIDGDVI